MKTITKNIYSFNELSKEAQEKAHSDYKTNNSYDGLTDYLYDNLKEYIRDIQIDDLQNLYYSLSYCQGDGVCFTGRFTYKDHDIEVKHNSPYYYHSKTVDITDLTEYEKETYDNTVEKEFQTIYEDICNQLEKDGYAYMDMEDSLETFEEICNNNEYYMFYEDGTLYNNNNN